jgi:NAD binding domain of 6-phosphogluconate dehydrogenase
MKSAPMAASARRRGEARAPRRERLRLGARAVPDRQLETFGLPVRRHAGAHRSKSAGCGFLDAPVGGSRRAAAAGQLTFYVGGEAETLEKARPALSAVGGKIHHLGIAGAGATWKLINNMLVAVQSAALAEALGRAKGWLRSRANAGADPRRRRREPDRAGQIAAHDRRQFRRDARSVTFCKTKLRGIKRWREGRSNHAGRPMSTSRERRRRLTPPRRRRTIALCPARQNISR